MITINAGRDDDRNCYHDLDAREDGGQVEDGGERDDDASQDGDSALTPPNADDDEEDGEGGSADDDEDERGRMDENGEEDRDDVTVMSAHATVSHDLLPSREHGVSPVANIACTPSSSLVDRVSASASSSSASNWSSLSCDRRASSPRWESVGACSKPYM
jgi:hypothetical protein